MGKQKISELILYRWRYQIGYTLFALALLALLLLAGFYIPGGLSADEINSALISDHLDPSSLMSLDPGQLLYLPYRLLQAGTISLFGFNIIGIKLPSIMIGFFSALGLVYLLNIWFRRNVAIITAVVAVTTAQFLLASQSGQAGIMYIFLSIAILISAWSIAQKSRVSNLWILVGAVIAGISLYFPLSGYILLALGLTTLIHPHPRYVLLKRTPKKFLIGAGLLFLAVIAPLIVGIVNDIDVLWRLIGVPVGSIDIINNAKILFTQYAAVYAPSSGRVITPVYGLGVLMLIGLGVYRLISAKSTTKSYIISIWLLLLTPLVSLNPQFISITFIPVVLLIALAIEYLIWSWYRLFPRNPYARLFGLLPLSILLFGLVVSSIDRYAYGYHYDSLTYSDYSFDTKILQKYLSTLDADQPVVLYVSQHNKALYKSLAEHQKYIDQIRVTDIPPRSTAADIVAERSVKNGMAELPTSVLVGNSANNADRFYVYKNSNE